VAEAALTARPGDPINIPTGGQGVLISGQQKLDRMRDGRVVYIGAERVDDVTSHPAFRAGARTVADLYDLKADPARREEMSFTEDGERYSLYWLRCRTRDDLARRMRACKIIADATYGYIGRSPDQVSGLITGLAMKPALLDGLRDGFGQNLLQYYDYARRNDLYLSFAVTPASGRKSADLFPGQQRDDPNLRVVAEDGEGVTVSGMKMLATSAIYSDEILIGNLTPIDEAFKSEAITAALPLNAPGVSLWSRQPYAYPVRHEADYPMSYRFDETDSVLVCEDVKIPWSRVFLHNDAAMSRRIYIETPANCYQNHQSNIRFWSKMGLIVGVASRICQANGTDKIPAVREVLGRLASLEALIGGLVAGQIEAFEEWPNGYATPNRRIMYAALNWCQEHHGEVIDTLRTLLGGYPMVMPASIDVVADAGLRDRFERWWKTPSVEAVERHKLYKLAWDLTGTEFAGRHMLYERFYAGSSIVVRNQSDREAPWQSFHQTVDRLLANIELPQI
jgi:4-hydroxyphenylacetate 3-monooxygenase